jgi:uncharacterized protein YndB with AHSA1/START domain
MAPIVSSVEIARRPEEVFSYVTDPAVSPEWQESLVSARAEGGGPAAVGSRVIQTRRVGRGERSVTMQTTEVSPPRSWTARGIDGPVRPIAKTTIDPLNDGSRSRVTIELDFEGHGIGRLLVPLVVRRQAKDELPRTTRHLKERLEGGAA